MKVEYINRQKSEKKIQIQSSAIVSVFHCTLILDPRDECSEEEEEEERTTVTVYCLLGFHSSSTNTTFIPARRIFISRA